MAKKKKESTKVGRYVVIKKLLAGVAMMAFVVVVISGLKSEVSLNTIAYRAAAAMFAVYVVNRIVIKVLASYEEMNSGKA
ncbi:MAG: hypothetical protein J5J00_05805 [Deltaproteobacteria bacterium]|nr:hypothetical protein [Deltaproteobacteria bacterium]